MTSTNFSSGLQTQQQKAVMESVVAPDGTRIAYQRNGVGPPLVLVHGGLDDHTTWNGLLPSLGEHFTVYAIDRRGRGGSDATDPATYAIEREFEDIATVVDAIREPVYLLGHSYGAICALEAALIISNVLKLILYEPPIPIPPGQPISPPGTPAKMENLLAQGDRDGAALIFAREIAQVSEEEIAAVHSSPAWQVVESVAHTIVYEVRAAQGYQFDYSRFRHLTTPTLLLMGSESPPYLKLATRAVAAALPNSRLAFLKAQGHLAMHTAPELFRREVIQFLTGNQAVHNFSE